MTSCQNSLTQKTRTKQWWKENFLLVKEAWDRDHLGKKDIHKPMDPDGMHPVVMTELSDTTFRWLTIIFEWLWRSGAVSECWEKANVTLIFKKGKKEDPENFNFSKDFSTPL